MTDDRATPDDRATHDDTDSTRARVSVSNVDGLADGSVALTPGLTVLAGGEKRTQEAFLSAVASVLGGSPPPLASGGSAARVALAVDGRSRERRFVDRPGRAAAEGSSFCEDETFVERFVALTADNPVRRAVEDGSDPRDLLTAPVDTAAIEAELRDRETELDEVEDRLATIDDRRQTLPELATERRRLEDDLADAAARLSECRATVEDDPPAAAADLTAAVTDRCAELRALGEDFADERDRLATLQVECASVERSLSTVDVDAARIEALDDRIDALRTRERTLTDTIADLSTVVQFNEEVLVAGGPSPVDPVLAAADDAVDAVTLADDDRPAEHGDGVTDSPAADVGRPSAGGAERSPVGGAGSDATGTTPVERAVPGRPARDRDETVECWTCGTEVPRAAVEDRLAEFRDRLERRRRRRRDLLDRIDELQAERADLEADRRERADLRERRTALEAEVERRRDRVDRLEARLERVHEEAVERVQTLDADLPDDPDLPTRLSTLADLEYERASLAGTLADVERQVAVVEDLVEEREAVLARRRSLRSDVENLRSTLRERERTTLAAVEERANVLLDRLDLPAVDGLRIAFPADDADGEATDVATDDSDDTDGEPTDDAAEPTDTAVFVHSTGDDDVVRERPVPDADERDRTVVGLVVALAAADVHGVGEAVPAVLADGLPALDADRTDALLGALADLAGIAVVGLPDDSPFPEDSTLPEEYDRLSGASLAP
jgi:cell division protein FtsB/flagellar motility protein MotE (MotC chaperone)